LSDRSSRVESHQILALFELILVKLFQQITKQNETKKKRNKKHFFLKDLKIESPKNTKKNDKNLNNNKKMRINNFFMMNDE